MPKIVVQIEWDKPDEQFWLNPDNVALALQVYCKNTHFVITSAQHPADGRDSDKFESNDEH